VALLAITLPPVTDFDYLITAQTSVLILVPQPRVAPNGKRYYLAVLTIFKNETDYLVEWLEYHLYVGVEHFFLYDNDSGDNPRPLLDRYIRAQLVTYVFRGGIGVKIRVQNEALAAFGHESFWFAIIDIDEFLVPMTAKTIPDCLREFEGEGGVALHQLHYGSSNREQKTKGLVIERFRMRSKLTNAFNGFTKLVVRAECVQSMRIHHAKWKNGFRSVDTHHRPFVRGWRGRSFHDRIRLNHYHLKSHWEFDRKRRRGCGSGRRALTKDHFYKPLFNIVPNETIMDPYVPIIKRRMQRRFGLPENDDSLW
jgi:hypothetical protein